MKLRIVPERVIPATYSVTFWEDRHTAGFVVSHEYRDDLREDIKEWLDANDPEWSVEFDRGDWGEGIARVAISFSSETAARQFHEVWNKGLCVEESIANCKNMKETSPDTYACDVCGESLKLLRNFPSKKD